MIYLNYLWYMIKHKWFVFIECCKVGLVWQGLVHDISKFRPDELFPYARHFGKYKNRRDSTGYYKPTDTGDPDFDFAWFLHQKRNPHHWQYWAFPDETGLKVLDMPEKYIKEMICDWKGAGKAQNSKTSCQDWYIKNNSKMQLSDKTRKCIEQKLHTDGVGRRTALRVLL